jgi:hypothetical protein
VVVRFNKANYFLHLVEQNKKIKGALNLDVFNTSNYPILTTSSHQKFYNEPHEKYAINTNNTVPVTGIFFL